MIYILSSNSDTSTSEVIEWLNWYNKEYLRINNLIELNESFYLKINSDRLSNLTNSRTISNKPDSVWYRKIEISPSVKNKDVGEFYKKETLRIIEYLFSGDKKFIGKPFTEINKLEVLVKALKHRIDIPETIITNAKEELLSFHKKHGKIISKPISEILVTVYSSPHF
jgi:hypothetical protein